MKSSPEMTETSTIRPPLARMSVIAPSLDDVVDRSIPNFNTDIPTVPRLYEDPEIPTEIRRRSKIPDGGWGWIVVLASLVLCMIQDGISFSFGILYVEFFHEFGASSTATSWIGSLFVAVPLLTGPIMSALVDKYGCQSMTIAAGIVSAAGFLLSSLAQSIEMLYFTFGILSALGLGLTFVTSVVCITFWFEKKRNLAVGLGACGIGIGTFIYAPLTSFLVDEFGWRGTLMVLAGTLLNMCVCGGLMRDPEWMRKSIDHDSFAMQSNQEEIRKMIESGKDADYILQSLVTSLHLENSLSDNKIKHYQSVVNLPTFIKQDEKIPVEVLENMKSSSSLYKIIMDNYPTSVHSRSTSDKSPNELDHSLTEPISVTLSAKLPRNEQPTSDTGVSEPLLLNQKRLTAGPNYLKNRRFSKHFMLRRVVNPRKYQLKAISCPNISRTSDKNGITTKDKSGWYSSVLESFKEMFDFSLFLELHFFLMAVSTLIVFAWFMTPYFYLADHMKLHGYTSTEASFLISLIGITNTIGMIVLGWAGDHAWADVTKIYALCLMLCGVFCSAIGYFTPNYVMLTISSALYGLTLASNFTFTPQILVELISMERFTIGYGLILLCQGIGHLVGPPIAGYLYDVTQTWDFSFHLSGAWIIISGLLILVIPYTNNRKLTGGSCRSINNDE